MRPTGLMVHLVLASDSGPSVTLEMVYSESSTCTHARTGSAYIAELLCHAMLYLTAAVPWPRANMALDLISMVPSATSHYISH